MTWVISFKGKEIGRISSDNADDKRDAVLNWADQEFEETLEAKEIDSE